MKNGLLILGGFSIGVGLISILADKENGIKIRNVVPIGLGVLSIAYGIYGINSQK